MATIALYRKYRPKSFAEVVGQEDTVRTLRNAVAMGLISHAYLFCGQRGSGKTTLARIVAKAVNCKRPDNGEPCNACEACGEINSGRAMDLIEIDAGSNRGIDEIRDLKESVRFAPSLLKYKVYVIDEAHQLTGAAANALLKTLEEPPAHAIFILATTEAHKMIPTILSRCQQFYFKKLTVPELILRLRSIIKAEEAAVDPAAVELIALHSAGSFRDAESLLDKILTFHLGAEKKKAITVEEVKSLLDIVDITVIADFAQLILEKKAAEAIGFLHEKLRDGMDPQEFAKSLIQYLRQAIIIKISPKLTEALSIGFTKEQEDRIKRQASDCNGKELQAAIEYFAKAENDMKYAPIIQLPLELAVLSCCGI